MLKAKELRDQTIDELKAVLVETRNAIYEFKNEIQQSKKLENPHVIPEKKKDVARILTVIREKQMEISKG